MNATAKWYQDADYMALIADLLEKEEVQKLANYTQHHHSDRLEHSLSVSYRSYEIAKKWHLNVRPQLPVRRLIYMICSYLRLA